MIYGGPYAEGVYGIGNVMGEEVRAVSAPQIAYND